jgi:hypothetical protein
VSRRSGASPQKSTLAFFAGRGTRGEKSPGYFGNGLKTRAETFGPTNAQPVALCGPTSGRSCARDRARAASASNRIIELAGENFPAKVLFRGAEAEFPLIDRKPHSRRFRFPPIAVDEGFDWEFPERVKLPLRALTAFRRFEPFLISRQPMGRTLQRSRYGCMSRAPVLEVRNSDKLKKTRDFGSFSRENAPFFAQFLTLSPFSNRRLHPLAAWPSGSPACGPLAVRARNRRDFRVIGFRSGKPCAGHVSRGT